MTSIAAYGTWESPISAADVARGAVAVSYPSIAGGEVWWQERRPSEGGRTTVVASAGPGATPRELLPAPWNARTRVHEYGGKSYLAVPSLSLAGGFDLVFANFADQRLYAAGGSVDDGASPLPLTPPDLGFRFADMVLSPDGQEIWCVRETTLPAAADGSAVPSGFHLGGGMAVRRDIVAVPLDGSAASDGAALRVLVSGAQFFAFPTPSPDGTRLAWINWNHPNMPWDGTELRVCRVAEDTVRVADATLVMGGPAESVLAPAWRDEGSLYAVSDASGWWNLYQVSASGGAPFALHPLAEEFAGPLWQLGGRPFDVLGDGRLVVLHGLGELRLALLDPDSGALTDLDLPGYRTCDAALAVAGSTVAATAGGPRIPWSVLRVSAGGGAADGAFEVMTSQPSAAPDPAYLPDARPVRLSAGPNGDVVHALVYAPAHPSLTGTAGELPPFIVHVHGGPTSNSVPVVSMEKAYFTSRGIGIIDVNYGGSAGYGREYRNRLRGEWGIVDVADAYTAALGLASSGEADRDRLGIRGGSAGGWTALVAVTSGPDLTGTKEAVFAAATSYYGVSDLRPFATDTHDFESRYLDGLIGPLPAADELYVTRAPVGHVNELTCPILLLQGLDDPVVPPSQSEAIAADLAAHGIRHAYIAFEGESHGFRKAETVIASLEAELAFYGRVFGFTPPGVPPIELSLRHGPRNLNCVSLPALQQPLWPDRERLDAVARSLECLPPLVLAAECDQLKDRLAAVARGEAFLLQGGDCAETFAGSTADSIRGKFQTLLQMAVVLTYAASVPVVKIGRMAGQFGKPRSSATEVRDGVALPVYRGDAVNGIEFTAADRTPDPGRLLEAYHCAAATLNLCRSLASGGFADLRQVHAWNQDFVAGSPAGQRYEQLANDIDRAITFMHACGADPREFRAVEFYSSHEALLLDYERPLTRIDPRNGRAYDLSAHLLWIGERTRDARGAHVEFARQISNPVAVKVGPNGSAQDVLELAEILDPDQEPGRLTVTTRMGARRIRDALPPLVEKVSASRAPVVWVCDPMHGNTVEAAGGQKTRNFDDVLDEVAGFFEVHRALGTHPGGIHIEFTGDDVTECLGGGHHIAESDLSYRYETTCDPRLNRSQSLDLAFRVAGLYRHHVSPAR